MNLVSAEAVALALTAAGSLVTRENGIVFCVGIPFSTETILSSTGKLGSLSWKKISTEERKIPVGSFPIINVCAIGSLRTIRSLIKTFLLS